MKTKNIKDRARIEDIRGKNPTARSAFRGGAGKLTRDVRAAVETSREVDRIKRFGRPVKKIEGSKLPRSPQEAVDYAPGGGESGRSERFARLLEKSLGDVKKPEKPFKEFRAEISREFSSQAKNVKLSAAKKKK